MLDGILRLSGTEENRWERSILRGLTVGLTVGMTVGVTEAVFSSEDSMKKKKVGIAQRSEFGVVHCKVLSNRQELTV